MNIDSHAQKFTKMVTVRVNAQIIEDSSGVATHIPVLLTEMGELKPLTNYLLLLQANGQSKSTLIKAARAVALLIEYMDANHDMFDDVKYMFQTFIRRLYSGTVGPDGIDPSGLYWIPASNRTAQEHINHLTRFTNFLADEQGAISMNPLTTASTHEIRINYAAWHNRNNHNFLGHLKNKSTSEIVKQTRAIRGRSPRRKTSGDALAFPTSKFQTFFRNGIGGAKDPRVGLRDQLIVLLMHGAGLRLSEAISLWVTDVYMHPHDTSQAIVRVWDEQEGNAPNGWKSKNGTKTRAAHLQEEYARIPRKNMHGTQHVGMKACVMDHDDGYLKVNWLLPKYAQIFYVIWNTYMRHRALVDAHHPYAFTSFSGSAAGDPYTINAFNGNYKAALKRVQLRPNKAEGFSPHGHRHSYARRMASAGIDPLLIQRSLHHSSLGSQLTYTKQDHQKLTDALQAAMEQLSATDWQPPEADWKSLLAHGFENNDPEGYFTGSNPKFKK